MKKDMLRKEFRREIRKSLNRFFSIFLIVALGVAFFAGVRVTEPDMRRSADKLFDESRMMDIRVMGTLGMTDYDLEQLSAVEGVEKAVGNYYQDMIGKNGDTELNLRVMSLQDEVDQITLTEGRMPEGPDECILDSKLALLGNYGTGDTIVFQEEEGEETLARQSYTVVGLADHPYYISLDRGSSSVGDGTLDGFLMLQKEEFTQDYYTDILILAEGSREPQCYSDSYQKIIDAVKERLEEMAGDQCSYRYIEVLTEAGEKLYDGRQELADGKKELEEELSEARKELEDGEQEIRDAEQKIADGEEELERGEQTISSREKQLAQAAEQLAEGEKQLAQAKKDLEENREKLDQAREVLPEQEEQLLLMEEQLKEAQAQWDAAKPALEAELAAQKTALEQLRITVSQLEAQVEAGASGLTEQLEAARAQLEAGEKQLAQAENELGAKEGELAQNWYALQLGKEQLEQGKKEIAQGEAELEEGEKQIEENEKNLISARNQIRTGRNQIADAREKLEESRKELEDARAELEDARAELEDGWKEYEEGRTDAEEEIREAEEELKDGELALRDIRVPDWYVLDRESIQVYTEYDRDAENIGAIGRVFPAIFFLVATLVSLTTMTRMVEEQRTQIGTLKALGYRKGKIAGKYIRYGMYACLGGSIVGTVIGEKLLPWVIITAYKTLYAGIPDVVNPLDLSYALSATLAACGCILFAILLSCYKELKEEPASLMRPEPPKQGKRILLERITFLWKRLSFTSKSTVRNLFRYKKRFFMTIFGVGGCMALLIVGYGLMDSIYVVSSEQYTNLHVYDGTIILNSTASDGEKEGLHQMLDENEDVQTFLYTRQETLDVRTEEAEKTATIFVPEEADRMEDFVHLRTRIGKKPCALGEDGAVLSEKLASMLGVKTGDSIQLKLDETTWRDVEVTGITENYFNSYLFLSPSSYESVFGQEADYNAILVDTVSREEELESRLGELLLKEEAVMSITFINVYQDKIENMLENLNVVIWVIIIAAGLLAFVVLYNLNNININERKRELATLKVLGFYDGEVASYVYRENILLTLIGILLGVVMGKLLHHFVITTVEVELMMFGRIINFSSYLYSGLLTLGFSLFVNWVMFFKLRKIDMVESLKSVE